MAAVVKRFKGSAKGTEAQGMKMCHAVKFFCLLRLLPEDLSEELLKKYDDYEDSDNIEGAYRWALDQVVL